MSPGRRPNQESPPDQTRSPTATSTRPAPIRIGPNEEDTRLALALQPRDQFWLRPSQPASSSLLASMAAPVLQREAPLLRFGAEYLAPLAVLEDDLVSAGKNLERPLHLAEI